MVKVIASRALRFRVNPTWTNPNGDDHYDVKPNPLPQDFPDPLVDTDHFRAAAKSGWIKLVKDHELVPVDSSSAIAAMGDDEILAELQRRGVTLPSHDLEPLDLTVVSDEDLASEFDKRMEFPAGYTFKAVQQEKAYRKSSGRDGDAGDWTEAGQDASGFPVPKGSAEDVTKPAAKTTKPVKPAAQ